MYCFVCQFNQASKTSHWIKWNQSLSIQGWKQIIICFCWPQRYLGLKIIYIHLCVISLVLQKPVRNTDIVCKVWVWQYFDTNILCHSARETESDKYLECLSRNTHRKPCISPVLIGSDRLNCNSRDISPLRKKHNLQTIGRNRAIN